MAEAPNPAVFDTCEYRPGSHGLYRPFSPSRHRVHPRVGDCGDRARGGLDTMDRLDLALALAGRDAARVQADDPGIDLGQAPPILGDRDRIEAAIAGRQSFGLPEHDFDTVASIWVAAFVASLGYPTGFSRCFRPGMQGDAATSPFVLQRVSEPVGVRAAQPSGAPVARLVQKHRSEPRRVHLSCPSGGRRRDRIRRQLGRQRHRPWAATMSGAFPKPRLSSPRRVQRHGQHPTGRIRRRLF